jgi:membrane-anchored protein YejM (alkaline phosphatase superfamily)
MKATTNVAYYVANLTYALRHPDALMPRFLMLDSPRKDYGAGQDDLARAERIYRWMLTMEDTMHAGGPVGRPFQMLLVDNDIPPAVRPRVTEVQLERESPLISAASGSG